MISLQNLMDAKSHCTSEGYAVSYLGAAERHINQVPGGVAFNAGFGRKRVIYLLAEPKQFSPNVVCERILTPEPINTDWPKTVRKEYVLRTLDTSHMSSKERYNECTHPVKAVAKQGYAFRELQEGDLEQVRELWKIWCERKLADPKTHRISFTAARYMRCVTDALAGHYKTKSYVLVNVEGRVAACRILQVTDSHAYDLAFFSDIEVKECSRAMQWLALQDMFNSGITEVNFGESTGQGLSHFKTRFKTEILKVYQYDKPAPKEKEALF